MATIDIRDVSKSYGRIDVLQSIDLSIEAGEFVVLVGPSGCGKSTLLRMIAGLEDVTEGEIAIAGRRANELPPRERNLAMVFQSYALYPHMSVAANMSYALRLRRTPKERIAAAVSNAAAKLGLTHLVDRRPKALSGGQRQRVAMGRAIVREPAAFLFDEPLSNLDARLRETMRAEIKTLHRTLGATSVYVTHDQIEAMTLADRIVAMDGGRIQQVGAPLELYDQPANRFVAGFIGSPAMNFIDGIVRGGADGPCLEMDGGGRLALPAARALQDGQSVSIGIRPEHVRLAGGGSGGAGGSPATVTLSEPTGLGTIVHLSLHGVSLKAFARSEAQALRPGDVVSVELPADRIFVFEAGTGDRLH